MNKGALQPQQWISRNDDDDDDSMLQTKAVAHMLELLDDDDMMMDNAQAYQHARQQCPTLILQESSPLAFLQREGFHSFAAAHRLAEYWKQRQEILQNAAFLSLQQQKNSSGCWIELPVQDNKGRRVLYHRQAAATVSKNQQQENLRSALALLSTNEQQQQTDGPSSSEFVLFVDSSLAATGLSLLLDPRIQEFILNATPWTLSAVYILCFKEETQQQPQLDPRIAQVTTFVQAPPTVADLVLRVREQCGGVILPTAELFGESLDSSSTRVQRSSSTEESLFNTTKSSSSSTNVHDVATTISVFDAGVSSCHQQQHDDGYSLKSDGAAIAPLLLPPPHRHQHGDRYQEGIKQVHEAIELLPNVEKQAYMIAYRQVPELIQLESDPVRFLKFEEFDIWKAASRLAVYWKMRHQLFQERAFLPMTLDGGKNGAMNAEAIAALESGYLSLPGVDEKGRTVFNYDGNKRTASISPEARARASFYIIQCVCENPKSQSDGFVVVVIPGMTTVPTETAAAATTTKKSQIPTIDNTSQFIVDMITKVFPTCAHKLHICNASSSSSNAGLLTTTTHRFFFEMLLPLAMRVCLPLLKDVKSGFHVGSTQEILNKLLFQYGMTADCLADTIGGRFTRQDHWKWVQARKVVEQERYRQWRNHHHQEEAQPPSKEQQVWGTTTTCRNNMAARVAEKKMEAAVGSASATTVATHSVVRATNPATTGTTAATTTTTRSIKTTTATKPLPPLQILPVISNEPFQQEDQAARRPLSPQAAASVAAATTTLQEEPPPPPGAALSDLYRAMEALPAKMRAAYDKAFATDPELIQRESSPISYLRHEQFNVTAAAERLAKYWQVRLEIFGPTNCYKPMNQTGEGALDRRDLAVLGTAYLMHLPHDRNGHAVVYCDGSRLSRSSHQSRLRCSFYVYSLAAETLTSAQTQQQTSGGFVLLYALTDPSFVRESRDTLELVLSAIPSCIRDLHLIHLDAHHSDDTQLPSGKAAKKTASPSSNRPTHVDPELLEQLRQMTQRQMYRHDSTSIPGCCLSIAQYLEQRHGLMQDTLPRAIGGTFGYEEFSQWQELRTRYEWDIPAGVANGSSTQQQQVQRLGRRLQPLYNFDFGRVVKPMSDMTEVERQERKRKLNVIHSRRKRERERVEIETLQEQCVEERQKSVHLQLEHSRLTELMAKAKSALLNIQ